MRQLNDYDVVSSVEMMKDSFTLPQKYTCYEAGEWSEWTYGELKPEWTHQRNHYDVKMGDRVVHSLYFNERVRWDCINGWTVK